MEKRDAGDVRRYASLLAWQWHRRERKMGKTLEVRLASAADLEVLVSLATAFRDHVGLSAPSEADFRTAIACLLQDRDTEFLVAWSACGGTSLGYVQSRYRYSAWTIALEAELEDVFVVPAARRCGVGHQLVACAMARATAKGCRTIGLNTNERNTGAVALYQKLGLSAARARWHGGRQLWRTKVLATT
jgi:ribosomal protein S18 acetylase RimI-like enzyme